MRCSLLLMGLWILTSCSMQKLAIRGSTPLFQDSSELLTRERNWDFFRESAPGNLKFMELLYLQDKDNLPLLAMVIKGYAGYAYGVPETLAFGEEMAGKDESAWKREAIHFYTRALDYGLVYFEKKGLKADDLLSFSDEKLREKLQKEMGEKDLIAVLYTAQAWGSLINLQKDKVALVGQVPKVKALFDWVCLKKPDIDHGVCDIFHAQYAASRPKMLGGNPEEARQLYAEAMKKYPRHLLLRLNYIQFMILPAYDGEAYEKVASELKEEFHQWDDQDRDELRNKSEYSKFPELNLFNAIARKRFEFIEKNKKKLF